MMNQKNDKLLILITVVFSIVAILSSLHRISIWYQRGGYEVAIIYNISKIIFMMSIDIYLFKRKVVLLFLAGLSLCIVIILFILLYDNFTSNGISNAFFQLILFVLGFLLCIWNLVKNHPRNKR